MNTTILDFFYKSCIKYPDKILFKDETSSVTYDEVQKLSQTLMIVSNWILSYILQKTCLIQIHCM